MRHGDDSQVTVTLFHQDNRQENNVYVIFLLQMIIKSIFYLSNHHEGVEMGAILEKLVVPMPDIRTLAGPEARIIMSLRLTAICLNANQSLLVGLLVRYPIVLYTSSEST